MSNAYYDSLKDFQQKIEYYVNEIFKVYGNELQLRLEDYNLLTSENNCLESSTAFGYIIEEFLVSKLEIYTQKHNLPTDYKIGRGSGSTTTASYDCSAEIQGGILAFVNIKADKKNNNAVSAINILYNDYVVHNPETPKCFLVLKIHYEISSSPKDHQRKIFVNEISSFFLEEVDNSKEHKQDSRNWSATFNANSGRLQASSAFRKSHKVDYDNVSYENTRNTIQAIYDRNLEKNKGQS